MGSLNSVQLIGHLGQDPEIKHTQSGNKLANLSLATSKSWKDRNTGEKREKTEWHRIVIFSEGLAGIAEQYLAKGSQIYVQGELQTRKWTDNGGIDRYSTEIVLQGFGAKLVMLGGKSKSGNGSGNSPDQASGYSDPPQMSGNQPDYDADLDDEIPF